MVRKSTAEFKNRIRDNAKRKLGGRHSMIGHGKFREDLEKGRKNLIKECSAAGATAASQIRNELEYLLNNYVPGSDSRILTLIDQWKRSHDPSYTPEINVRFRRIKAEYTSRANPL